MERIAIFPGSFDPFTKGHESLLRRGLTLFDRIVIGVGINQSKQALQSTDQRIESLRKLFAGDPRIEVEGYSDLTVDFARRHHARFILRGVRSTSDFEYEQQMAATNQRISGIETILLFSDPKLSYISSSMVRELMQYDSDVSPFLPKGLDLAKWKK